jgi:hypothetical protein
VDPHQQRRGDDRLRHGHPDQQGLAQRAVRIPGTATSTGDGSTHTVNGMVITSETALNSDDSRLGGPVEVTRGIGGQIQVWTALDAAVSARGDIAARDAAGSRSTPPASTWPGRDT